MRLASRVLTVIEDRLLTAPNPFFAPAFRIDDEDAIASAAARIQSVGGMDAGVIVSQETCADMRARLDLAYEGKLEGVRGRVNPKTGIAQMLNPLRLHPAMIELATHPFLLAIVERYLRRRIYLADVDVRRVPPMTMGDLDARAGTASVGYTSSHWHRDIRGRQAKVMIYLSDVGETDSNFAYLPGSHLGFQHRPGNVERSRLSDEQVRATGIAPVECYGAAGTALVFDTNCIHRLRRKPTARVRDSVTFYYTPGQELRTLDLDAHALAMLPAAARAIFGGSGREAH